MQLSIYIIGAIALVVIVFLMIVLAPSMRNRGYTDTREKDTLELEKIVDQEIERAKGQRRYQY
ncbi:MAG: hypothetical protein ACFFF4_15765 [Candidatus Thorarchaeota archaeon]